MLITGMYVGHGIRFRLTDLVSSTVRSELQLRGRRKIVDLPVEDLVLRAANLQLKKKKEEDVRGMINSLDHR